MLLLFLIVLYGYLEVLYTGFVNRSFGFLCINIFIKEKTLLPLPSCSWQFKLINYCTNCFLFYMLHSCDLMRNMQNTRGLERALRENIGWQQLMKRGIHTLNKPQYQVSLYYKLIS